MEFRETLLAAQRNQQQNSSERNFYKARFDPPKKEQKQKDKLSANIQKFLAKKDEEERQKKIEAQRKREELLAMRDPKALRKIQKTLKVIKSANKSVLEDAVNRDNTAITLAGPDQPDQDDYGYESQEAAALYEKMMQKYSKIPDEPKFPVGRTTVKKDLNGTRERVRNALQHEDEPQPHKRKRRTDAERELSPSSKYEPEKEKEKEKEKKPDKPKIRKPMPPPMDFNQLLKLAEAKKSEPIEVAAKKTAVETSEPERLMTKKQKREYEEEMARRQRRQERIEAEKSGGRKMHKEDREKPVERERKPETIGFGRIPKIGDRANNNRHDSPKTSDKDRERDRYEKDRAEKQRERERAIREKEKEILDKEKAERDRIKVDKERLDRLKAERDRIDREMERLNKDRERLDKTKSKLESKTDKRPLDKTVDRKMSSKESIRPDVKKSIDLKSQNTYRIDKTSSDKKPVPGRSGDTKYINGHSSQSVPKQMSQKDRPPMGRKVEPHGHLKSDNGKRLPDIKGAQKRPDGRPQAGASKPVISNSFDFDKHVNSLQGKKFPPGDVKRKPQPDSMRKPSRGPIDSDEYDSEMDDFIDDGEEDMDYSRHIKEIFGYDKNKYRHIDDEDDPSMESNFVQQQKEELISKKIGIMEDLEDMRLEAMEKKKKKKRRISDD